MQFVDAGYPLCERLFEGEREVGYERREREGVMRLRR